MLRENIRGFRGWDSGTVAQGEARPHSLLALRESTRLGVTVTESIRRGKTAWTTQIRALTGTLRVDRME